MRYFKELLSETENISFEKLVPLKLIFFTNNEGNNQDDFNLVFTRHVVICKMSLLLN